MDQATLDRLNNKDAMIALRRAIFGHCRCDLCHEQPGTEMHEIVARRYTVNQPELRILSFQVELCSLLCSFCHATKAETKEGRAKLIEFNVSLYGRQAVFAAITAIPERFWQHLIDRGFLEEANG